MEDKGTTLTVSIDLAVAALPAFALFADELAVALAQGGMAFEAGTNGRLTEGDFEVGRVVAWTPGELIRLQWRQADWQPEEVTNVEVRFTPVGGGTHVTLEHRGWGELIGDPGELAGWRAGSPAPWQRLSCG